MLALLILDGSGDLFFCSFALHFPYYLGMLQFRYGNFFTDTGLNFTSLVIDLRLSIKVDLSFNFDGCHRMGRSSTVNYFFASINTGL